MSFIQRNSAFKATRVDWLDTIPDDWNETRVKYAFDERVEKGFPNEPLLAATQSRGVVRKEDYENSTVTAQKDLHLLKLVRVGDFVISLRSFQGGIEVAHYQGIISPAYTVMNLYEEIENGYIKHLFKSKYFINGLTTFVTGIREGQNIDYSKFRRSFIPIPPSSEQTAIANFLDKKTAEIKRFIELKEKTIELLKERKTAIINQAVTKGLDPNVEMKDSGIEWLGEIPAHWEVKKFSHTVKLRHGYQFRDYDFKLEGAKVVKISQLSPNGYLDFSKVTFIDPIRVNQFRDILIQEGDILMALTGGTIGKIIRVGKVDEPLLQNYRVGAFYPIGNSLSMDMLFWILSSESVLAQIFKDQSETGQPNIGKEDMGNMYFSLPPLNEQNNIVEHILSATNSINELIIQAEKEIELIKEYQESLISEAVTGKIDVREYVAEAS